MDQQKQTILIIGGCGFVGSALTNYFLKNTNAILYILDNFSSSSNECEYKSFFKTNPSFITAKLNDRLIITNAHSSEVFVHYNVIQPDIIFHFGEFSRINASWKETEKVFKSNLYGTTRVLDYAVAKKSLLIYSASSAILGSQEDAQATPYTYTKWCMVQLIKNYQKWFGLRSCITYFYNVYGKGQLSIGPYATVLGIFEEQYKKGEPLTVVKPGTQSRCFTHIDDVISALITITDHQEICIGKDIPIGSNDEITIEDLAKQFSKHIILLESRQGDRTMSKKVLPDLLRDKCKWNTKNNLENYIKNII